MRDDKAVSDTVGVVLMVVIAVVMAGIVYFWVGFKGSGAAAVPELALKQRDQANGGRSAFDVTSISGAAKWSDIVITIDGSKATYDGTLSGSAKFCVVEVGGTACVPTDTWKPDTPIQAGQVLFFHDPSLDFGSKVNVIHAPSNAALDTIKIK